MSGEVVLVKVRSANVYVQRKNLPAFKALFPETMVIAAMEPNSDSLNGFIGMPAILISVERGLAVKAGKSLSIGMDFSWHDSTNKRIYSFEDGVLVGRRD